MNRKIFLFINVFFVLFLSFLFFSPRIYASVNLTDNFNSGSQNTWINIDGGDNSTHLFQNDRYELHTESSNGSAKSFASYVDQTNNNSIVQTRVQKINSGDNFLTYLLMRINPSTMSGYTCGISSDGTNHFWFGKLTNGVYSNLTTIGTATYNSSDFKFRCAAIGSSLVAKVWNSSDSEPANWQISSIDSSYTSGSNGVMLATYPTLNWNTVQVAVDDFSTQGLSKSEVWVDDDWAGTTANTEVALGKIFGYNAFATIQEGVSSVDVGGTVNVAAGTYTEQISITKSITLQGTGDTTIIKPSSLTTYITTRLAQGSTVATGIIIVNNAGGDVVLKNLKVDAASLSTDRSAWFSPTVALMRFGGIFFYRTSGTIDSITSTNTNHITIAPTGANTWGRQIHSFWIDSDALSSTSIEIKNSTASNFLSEGIKVGSVSPANITMNIHDNTITGDGILSTRRQNGIQVYYGTITAISNNTISNLAYDNTNWATGIMVTSVQSGAVIEDNTITDTDFGITDTFSSGIIIQHNNLTGSGHTYGTGIYLDNGQASLTDVTVHGNIISDGFSLGGICLQGWYPGSNTVTATINDNILTGDETSGSSGIFDWSGAGSIGATISGNTISGWDKGMFFEAGAPVSGYTVINNSIFDNTSYNLQNNESGFINATSNWWGIDVHKIIQSKIRGNVEFTPFYVNANKTILSTTVTDGTATISGSENHQVFLTDYTLPVTVTVESGTTNPSIDVSDLISNGTGTLPEIDIIANNANGIEILIPASTTITSTDSDWDGVFAAPVVTTVSLPQTSGETKILGMAIEVGLGDTQLSFDKAVRIDFPGQAGKRVGFSRNDVFTEITTTCGTDSGTTLGIDEDCKIDVGNDLVVWTRHFTKFVTFSSTSTTSSSSTSSTSTGWAAPACTATKPGSAPTITNTVNGDNSITLTWSKASNPFTHYLVAYGTSSGSIEYGNPNVGNADTTSYTIKGLSGGTRYYFKIKAINDCMPGDWSNEVSATPRGRVIEIITGGATTGETITTQPAEGFVPVSQIPSELFDIALIVDKTQITNVSELTARVTFVSFGNKDTPVEMTFTIVDEKGKEYYRSVDNTTIQTEGVFNKTFEGLLLDKGKYTLVLNTLYNTNIRDEFKQNFEINETVPASPLTKFLSNKPLMIGIGAGIILIIISWIIGLMGKRKKK